ncbi:MAG TPA: hypothetical protein VL995_14610 [Cellvibrio sp.]|nr:hypothetical protein [Cellvibrio sp.]
MKSFVLLAVVLFIQGCSIFTPPMETPVIEEKLNSQFMKKAAVGTLSLTPDRRVVLVNFDSNRFCAEAPTEVGNDLSRVLQATADADIPSEVKAKIGVATAVASSNSVLNKRTQGMQLFLANSYFVCQMYMNKAINEEQLLKYQMAVFNSAATLIEKELPLMYQGDDKATKAESKFKPFNADKLLKEILELQDDDENTSSSEAQPTPDPAAQKVAPPSDKQ